MKNRPRTLGILVPVVLLGLAACASTPQEPVSERVDPDTATTVTVIDRPIELVAEQSRTPDPFAYIAPFETDRMGQRSLYLWVATPDAAGLRPQPQLLCDGQPVGLQPTEGNLANLQLSAPPYTSPAPWSAQWYFRLPPEGLKCLAGARDIALETPAPEGTPVRFVAHPKHLASMEAFARR